MPMFDKLTQRLSTAIEALRGRGRLTDENVADTLRQVRMALIEADVAVPVVKAFVDAVRVRALGAEVEKSLTPGQVFIKIIHDELVRVMGEPGAGLNLRAQPPVAVLLAGLQGAGKTTTAAKLGRLLMAEKKRVLLVSTDVYRPAAITQLERLAGQIGAGFVAPPPGAEPVAIAREAQSQARRGLWDVLIVDTAGRLHVDGEMMEEIRAIDRELGSHERLFVVDSMAGQDAVNAARAFNAALDLTGIVLTKADGDARGGAALSVRHVTGKPILYMGVGEKIDALEPFHPERVASRILGMGDVLSLVEQVQRDADHDQADRLAKKLQKGKAFDFNDLREQMQQLEKLGGFGALLDKLPGQLSQAAARAPGQFEERQVRRQIAMINSMTPQERRAPGVIDGSRKRRIANGAGVQVQDVNRLLKQFLQMQRVMKQFSKGGVRGLMRALGGRLPPGSRG
jgi:signal recognition particle subunit SRP54